MADSCQTPSIQVRLYLIFSLILIRLALGLKQIPPEKGSNMSILSVFQRSGKKVIDEQPNFSVAC